MTYTGQVPYQDNNCQTVYKNESYSISKCFKSNFYFPFITARQINLVLLMRYFLNSLFGS